MPQVTYTQAYKQAIYEEMRRDSRVFILGEDVEIASFADGVAEFGRTRIRNTPICEAGFIGAGIGAALTGMRPVVEAAVSTFLYSAMDQIANQAAKTRYMFGGQASVPIVIRSTLFYGASSAAHHADRPWALFAQIPGLKIITPSTPYDAKGLMKSAIRDLNPVLCFDDFTLLGLPGEVPHDDYAIPIGVADIKRTGSDLSIVTLAGGVKTSLTAAEELEETGISAEVVDIRSVVPLDHGAILDSVAKTGLLLIVDPAPRTCSVASEVAASVAEHGFGYLKAPVVRLTAPDVPVPFSPELEKRLYPTAGAIATAARKLCDRVRR
mgnify:CR=1 FL=1